MSDCIRRAAHYPTAAGCLAATLLTVLLVTEARAQDAFVRVEAEAMSLSGFRTENVSGSSDGELINLKGRATSGSATTTFEGTTGIYDIFVGYHDEQDGDAELAISIAGALVDSWQLNQSPGGTQPNAGNFLLRQVAANLSVTNGADIEIAGLQDVWDNANVDYIEFVAADGGGGPPPPPPAAERVARVATSGGDYASIGEAIRNLDSGVEWCRPPVDDEEPELDCLITVAPGEYVEDALRVPSRVSIVGAGPDVTTITAAPGVGTALFLSPNSSAGGPMLVAGLTLQNLSGDGNQSFGIQTFDALSATIENVHVVVSGSRSNIAVRENDEPGTTYRNVRLTASGGDTALGIRAYSQTTMSDCVVSVSGATSNTGVLTGAEGEEFADLRMSGCSVSIRGGQSGVGIDFPQSDALLSVTHSRIAVSDASQSTTGITGRGFGNNLSADSVDIEASSARAGAVNTAIALTPGDSDANAAAGRLLRVAARAGLGAVNRALVLAGSSTAPLEVNESSFDAGQGNGQHFGVVVESAGTSDVRINRSTLAGSSASLSLDAIAPSGRIGIGASQLVGPFVIPATVTNEVRCAGVYDQDYSFFGGDCPP